jgi:ATP-dependent Clp protease ATP-binding subunit ClpA
MQRDVATAAVVTLSPVAQECISRARAEAQQMGDDEVQPGHLLLGCLRVGQSAATPHDPDTDQDGAQSVAKKEAAGEEVRCGCSCHVLVAVVSV